jgi:hypothetical protein
MVKKVKVKLSETKNKVGKTNLVDLKKQHGEANKNVQPMQKTRG